METKFAHEIEVGDWLFVGSELVPTRSSVVEYIDLYPNGDIRVEFYDDTTTDRWVARFLPSDTVQVDDE